MGGPGLLPSTQRALITSRPEQTFMLHDCKPVAAEWASPHKLHNCIPLPSDVLGLSFNKAFGVSVHLNQQFSIHDHAYTWRALKNSFQCYRCISLLSRKILLLVFCILPFNRPISVKYSGSWAVSILASWSIAVSGLLKTWESQVTRVGNRQQFRPQRFSGRLSSVFSRNRSENTNSSRGESEIENVRDGEREI